MKKQILNIGKVLNKAEQKLINGGGGHEPEFCESNEDCSPGLGCCLAMNECLTTHDWIYANSQGFC